MRVSQKAGRNRASSPVGQVEILDARELGPGVLCPVFRIPDATLPLPSRTQDSVQMPSHRGFVRQIGRLLEGAETTGICAAEASTGAETTGNEGNICSPWPLPLNNQEDPRPLFSGDVLPVTKIQTPT